MAEVDLLIGGEYKGTFYFGDAYPAEYMIQDIYHGTGSQVIELKVTSDNGLWDVFYGLFADQLECVCCVVQKRLKNKKRYEVG